MREPAAIQGPQRSQAEVNLLKRETENTAIGAFCVVGLAVVVGGHLYAGIALWAIGYLGVLRRCKFLKRTKYLGRQLIARTVLVLVPAAVTTTHRPVQHSWVPWAAVVLVALTIRNEVIMRRAASYTGLRASEIPGLVLPSKKVRLLKAYGLSALFLPLLLMLCALVDGPVFLWLAGAVAVALLALGICLDAVQRRAASRRAVEEIPELLAAMAPEFVLYWDAPRNSQFQIAMWVPHLKNIGRPFFIMVRNAKSFGQAVKIADGVPVLYCRTMADVERAKPDSIRAAFYVNNAARNSHFVRYNEITHVQLLHGDSDKAPSFNPVTAMFDKIFVAGQAGIDRYADHNVDVAPEKFEIVGRPQVVGIEGPRCDVHETGPQTVLYAPTWKGYHEDASHSSMPLALDIVRELLDAGLTIIFRPHPYCYRDSDYRALVNEVKAFLRADSEASGRPHVCGLAAERAELQDCFNASDLMVADVSSVVPDFLYSTKPFILVDPERDTERFIEMFPLARAAYVIDGSSRQLAASLESVRDRDPLADRRKKERAHYLGDFPASSYEDAFLTAARAVVSASPAAVVNSTDDNLAPSARGSRSTDVTAVVSTGSLRDVFVAAGDNS